MKRIEILTSHAHAVDREVEYCVETLLQFRIIRLCAKLLCQYPRFIHREVLVDFMKIENNFLDTSTEL
jgi:hypothetical protein